MSGRGHGEKNERGWKVRTGTGWVHGKGLKPGHCEGFLIRLAGFPPIARCGLKAINGRRYCTKHIKRAEWMDAMSACLHPDWEEVIRGIVAVKDAEIDALARRSGAAGAPAAEEPAPPKKKQARKRAAAPKRPAPKKQAQKPPPTTEGPGGSAKGTVTPAEVRSRAPEPQPVRRRRGLMSKERARELLLGGLK